MTSVACMQMESVSEKEVCSRFWSYPSEKVGMQGSIVACLGRVADGARCRADSRWRIAAGLDRVCDLCVKPDGPVQRQQPAAQRALDTLLLKGHHTQHHYACFS